MTIFWGYNFVKTDISDVKQIGLRNREYSPDSYLHYHLAAEQRLFTLEKEAEMLRIGQRKLTESAKTVNKNTQHWQTQPKKRPVRQSGQYNPTAELNTWQMTPKSVPLEECHCMSTPLVTSANMLGPWQAQPTTQVQHQQQNYIPETHTSSRYLNSNIK